MSVTREQRERAFAALARRAAPPARGRGRAPRVEFDRAQRARSDAAGRRAKPVSKATLDALRRVERELARATPATAATTILAIVRELRGVDALSVEVGRAGTVAQLAVLGVPDAESAVDAAFTHYGITRRYASSGLRSAT